MISVIDDLKQRFSAAIKSAFLIEQEAVITPAQQDRWGDYQCNSAMAVAKLASEKSGNKINPRQAAQDIISHAEVADLAEEISIAGPGFINIRLRKDYLAHQLQKLMESDRLGIEPVSAENRVVVDYSGPNIAKQMHVGHLRSTIIGDAISRVLEYTGNTVIRQNHLGDWGTQFGMLIAHLREFGDTGAESHISDLEQFYRDAKQRFDNDPSFQEESRNAVVRLQAHEAAELEAWQKIVEETRRHYQPIYKRLGVKLTEKDERGESFYNSYLAEVVGELRHKGIAVESDGATVVFAEGFEAPLIIEKRGGGYLYGTTDLAAIRYRVMQLRANRIIYTHDSRQAQHFSQVFWTAKQAEWAVDVQLEYAPFGTMLGEDQKPFKTRSGATVKLKDLLDEACERASAIVQNKNSSLDAQEQAAIAESVGIGAVKYSDLSKDRVSDYVFSWDKMLAMDGNTAPYLQYAFARIRAILRKADEAGVPGAEHNVVIEAAAEVSLAKSLLRFSSVMELVSRELKPHHLCTFLYEIATAFSSFYENCPVLQSDEPTRGSRLLLCGLTARVLSTGLDLLGIDHPERM